MNNDLFLLCLIYLVNVDNNGPVFYHISEQCGINKLNNKLGSVYGSERGVKPVKSGHGHYYFGLSEWWW